MTAVIAFRRVTPRGSGTGISEIESVPENLAFSRAKPVGIIVRGITSTLDWFSRRRLDQRVVLVICLAHSNAGRVFNSSALVKNSQIPPDLGT